MSAHKSSINTKTPKLNQNAKVTTIPDKNTPSILKYPPLLFLLPIISSQTTIPGSSEPSSPGTDHSSFPRVSLMKSLLLHFELTSLAT